VQIVVKECPPLRRGRVEEQSGLGEVDLGKRHSARQLELNIEEPVLSLGFFPSPGLAVARKNSEYD
jgi:hypothetical protein